MELVIKCLRILIFLWLVYSVSLTSLAQEPIKAPFDPNYVILKLEAADDSRSLPTLSTLLEDLPIDSFDPILSGRTDRRKRQGRSVLDGVYKVKFSRPVQDMSKILQDLADSPGVVYAEPVFYDYPLDQIPNDPLSNPTNGSQYYLGLVQAYDAWDVTTGDQSVRVAVLDTGIEPDHQDLGNIYVKEDDPIDGIDNDGNGFVDDFMGWDFADLDNDPLSDQSDHGLRVTSISNAEVGNGVGMAGIGYNSTYVPIKIFRSESGISNNAYEAIVYAAEEGYEVINLSWGSPNSFSQFRQDVINFAVLERDAVVIAAAGNTPANLDFYPASYQHVLSVASSDQNDLKAEFSTFSYHIDLVAPGSQITAARTDNGYAAFSGTSFSAPQVSGAAALLRHLHPEWSALQVMEQLRVTVDEIDDTGFEEQLGRGRLNVLRALTEAETKASRVEDFSFDNGFGEFAYFGDTVTVSMNLQNYLSPIAGLQLNFSSLSSEAQVIDSNWSVGDIDSLQGVIGSFRFVLSPDTENDRELLFRIGYEGQDYEDVQFFNIVTSRDRLDFGVSESFLTTSSTSELGYLSFDTDNGVGFRWNNNRLLEGIGLMIGDVDRGLVDNAYNNLTIGTRNNDYEEILPLRLYRHPEADFYASGIFSTRDNVGLNLEIEQNYYAWQSPGEESNIIVEFRVTNFSGQLYDSLAVGLLANWDVNTLSNNTAIFDEENLIASVFAPDSMVFTGFSVLMSDEIETNYASLDVTQRLANNQSVLSDSDKIAQLFVSDNEKLEGTDVIQTLTAVIGDIEPFESKKVAFVLSAADNIPQLQEQITIARERYQNILINPRITEFALTCIGGDISLGFTEGENFNFFQDPAGPIVAQGPSLELLDLQQDTVVYFQRLGDSGEVSDIFGYQVNVIPTIANFDISPDTLFLGDGSNLVEIIDRTANAVAWSWDLGNGLFSSVQNPRTIYNQEGTFNITLEVTSSFGCTDELTKQLVVSRRGELPIIEDLDSICVGEQVTINSTNVTQINVYFDQSLDSLLFSGEQFMSPPLFNNQIFYVTNGDVVVESAAVPVQVIVEEVLPQVIIVPDTLNLQENVINLSVETPEEFNNFSWEINGEVIGSDPTANHPVSDEQMLEINLRVENQNGCVGESSQVIEPSASEIPFLTNQFICAGTDLVLSPVNGTFFSFHREQNSMAAIHKGTSVTIENVVRDTVIFIRGIDNFLPSNPIRVEIFVEDFPVEVIATTTDLVLDPPGFAQPVTFSAAGEDLVNYSWFIDEQLVEQVEQPTLFFDTPGDFVVRLVVQNTNNCTASDTVLVSVREPSIVTGIEDRFDDFRLHPNPSKGEFYLTNDVKFVSIFSLSGQELNVRSYDNLKVDASNLNEGVYFVVMSLKDGSNHVEKLVLRK